MHHLSRPWSARLSRGLLLLGLVTLTTARAESSGPREYTRYIFAPLAESSDGLLDLEQLEIFVVLGRLREPAFVRVKSRAFVADRWVDLEAGEQELKYYDADEYARVENAIEAQAQYFGDLVGVRPPPATRVEIQPDAVIAAAWFENMERATRQTQRPGPNVFVVSEVALLSTREDFVRALNPRPVNVRLRLLRWDSSAPGRFERLERVIPGRAWPAELKPEDQLAIHVHFAAPECGRDFLN